MHDEVTSRALVGIEDRSVFERTWALPTFEIHGIRGGFVGDGAKTVIPALATAKVSMRLVPGLSRTSLPGNNCARRAGDWRPIMPTSKSVSFMGPIRCRST